VSESSYRPGELYFFGGWSGYDPPVNPRFPIDYATAEGKAAFSVFTFDAGGRPLSFEKWLVTRSPADQSALPDGLPPGVHYFESSASGSSVPDRVLSLEETRPPVADYHRAVVDDGGATRLERVQRVRMIHHVYSYWENGVLREFRSEPATEPGSVATYDRSGNEVR